MPKSAILTSEEHTRLLAEVMEALERRASLPGGAAREDLDQRLVVALDHLDRSPLHLARKISEAPPRPIAVAMALTIFSQPHVVSTFGRPTGSSSGRRAADPVQVPIESLSELLGLPKWELEELQGEIDRRVSLHLKQHRALSWMWMHFGLPDEGVGALVEVLFPGLREDSAGTVGLSRRGGQLYALVDQARGPAPAALYLAWLDRKLEGAIPPRGTFAARYVDLSLLGQLTRGIGAEAGEVALLLDRMVTVVPRSDAPSCLAADRWRALGYEAITGLAGAYPRGAGLLDPVAAEALGFEGWLRRGPDGGVQIDNGKALFDSLALDRAGEVARQLHAHVAAAVLALGEEAVEHDLDELLRYEVRRHLRLVLEPLVAWTRDPATAQRVATRLDVPLPQATQALQRLGEAWRHHLDTTWTGGLESGRPASVAARLVAQLVRTRQSLGQLWRLDPYMGQEHREAALLFMAHYFAEAPLDCMWARDQDHLSEDPVGHWFWPTWLSVLAIDAEYQADETFGG